MLGRSAEFDNLFNQFEQNVRSTAKEFHFSKNKQLREVEVKLIELDEMRAIGVYIRLTGEREYGGWFNDEMREFFKAAFDNEPLTYILGTFSRLDRLCLSAKIKNVNGGVFKGSVTANR